MFAEYETSVPCLVYARGQQFTVYGANPGPWLVFINKALLEHSHTIDLHIVYKSHCATGAEW